LFPNNRLHPKYLFKPAENVSMSRKEWIELGIGTAVVFFALWLRLEYQATTLVDTPLRADAGQYFRIAWNIVNHGVFSMDYPGEAIPSPDSYRGPGFPLLIASSLVLGGEGFYSHLMFTQAVLGALSVALTIALARIWLTPAYSIATGLLVAIWPHLIVMSGYVLTETLFGFTLMLGTYLLCSAKKNEKPYRYVLAGLVFAFSALVNPAILLFPVLVCAGLFFTTRKSAVIFLLCSLLLPTAWSIRGSMLETGRTTGGRLMENVLAGMEPDFDYGDSAQAKAAKTRIFAGLKSSRENSLGELNNIVDRLVQEPAFYAKWYLVDKPQQFWQWSIVHGRGDIYVYPVVFSTYQTNSFYRAMASLCVGLNLPLMFAAFGFVLVFSTRAARGKLQDDDIPLAIVTVLFVYATVLHSILTPEPRYAIPFRPFEMLLAVSMVALAHQYLRDRKQSDDQLTRTEPD
jgi:4-amino-4-deoxy-L-arabinose transferase-like glycosyltransferase